MRRNLQLPGVVLIVGLHLLLSSCSATAIQSLSLDDLTSGGGSSATNLNAALDLFNNEDLIAFVQELECQAEVDDNGNGGTATSTATPASCYLPVGKVTGVLEDEDEESGSTTMGSSSKVNATTTTTTPSVGHTRLSLLDDEDDDEEEDGDDEQDEEDDAVDADLDLLLPRDLSDLAEEISDDVTAGVEESLRMFGGSLTKGVNQSDIAEMRQLPMYMFQGQYTSEPRLNRFIDGAVTNMGAEVRISSMDPIFFRVMPRGRILESGKPARVQGVKTKVKRRPVGRRKRSSNLAADNDDDAHLDLDDLDLDDDLKPGSASSSGVEEGRGVFGSRFGFRRRSQILAARKRKRANRIRARRRRQRARKRRNRLRRRRRKGGGVGGAVIIRPVRNQNRKKKQKKGKAKKNVKRFRRFARKNVGGGKVMGLSRVFRDGDAEMQLFGNYTLIRSHMKIGPVDLTMQFRTKKGIRRTGATLPVLRAHTVTRVNHEGSEMVDFLLDRPHPETIQLRGNLFPKARKIARSVFSRLFLPDSFLISRMREKTGLALLSKPTVPDNPYGSSHNYGS